MAVETNHNPDPGDGDRPAGTQPLPPVTHTGQPHTPGTARGCAGCETRCHCGPDQTQCVFNGVHDHRYRPDRFTEWWHQQVEQLAPTISMKAQQYGSNSLAEMGRFVSRAQQRDTTEPTALEYGCFLYAHGKIARVADAILAGTTPSEDTWVDAMVYAAMALYIRQHQTWP